MSKKIDSALKDLIKALKGGGKTGLPTGGATIASIKAHPTGDQQHDEYCRGVAALIDEAVEQGDAAWASGDTQGAAEWWALAEYYLERATRNGCRFTFLRHRVGRVQQPQETLALTPR